MLQSYSNFAISFDPSLKIQASNKIHLSNSISRSFKFTQIFDLGASQLNKLSLPLYDSQKHPLLAKPSRSIFSPFDTVVPRPFPPHPPFDPPSSFSSSLSFAPTTKRWKKSLFLGRHFFPRASYMAYRLAYNHTPSPLPPTVLFGMASHRRPGAADRPLITSRSRY